jgi:hypothetical protein
MGGSPKKVESGDWRLSLIILQGEIIHLPLHRLQ